MYFFLGLTLTKIKELFKIYIEQNIVIESNTLKLKQNVNT